MSVTLTHNETPLGLNVELVIEGEPYSKARPRFVKGGGVYTPRKQAENAEELAWHFRLAMKHRRFTTNVAVGLAFYRSNRQRIDLDNLIKQALDAATGIVWADDSQVTQITAALRYDPERPRTCIKFEIDSASNMPRGDSKYEVAVCGGCGKSFRYVVYPSTETPKYCSVPCRTRRPKICAECGVEFSPRSHHQVFCGKPCASKSKAIRAKISAAAIARARPANFCRSCGVRLQRHSAVMCRACWLAAPGKKTTRREILAAEQEAA